MKPLDFLIIGAQKSATTVLHRYLGEHPAIAMPASKEVPYFTDSEAEAESWQAFSRKWFRHADPTVLWGKATPQYMADHRVPGRIHALMPNTKLIAILRDPIDRAWSHYQMARRRETETRDFEGAMRFAMDPDVLRSARSSSVPKHEHGYEAEDNFYLAWSEYGRILLEYQRYFPREQILVLLTEDLRQDPGRELDRVLSFLGLNPGYRPASFGKIVHKGSGLRIVSDKWRKTLLALPPVQYLWKRVPACKREKLRYWYEQINVRRKGKHMILTAELESRLCQFFAPDLNKLIAHFGVVPSWASSYTLDSPAWVRLGEPHSGDVPGLSLVSGFPLEARN